MYKRTRALFTLAAVVLIGSSACDSPSDVATGRLSILLTDGPGDVLEAWVTISSVYMIASAEEGAEGAEGEDPGARVELLAEPITTELLALQNATEPLVSDQVVAADRYHQMRFVIPEACIVVEVSDTEVAVYSSSPDFLECGTSTGTLTIPSYEQSGLKVIFPGGPTEVVEDESATAVVDFEVAESFGHATGSGGWVMDPVLRGVMQ